MNLYVYLLMPMCRSDTFQSLRLVLNAIATAASRYGRSITPLLSLSIDFYVRIFVRVRTSPTEVKKLARLVLYLEYVHN